MSARIWRMFQWLIRTVEDAGMSHACQHNKLCLRRCKENLEKSSLSSGPAFWISLYQTTIWRWYHYGKRYVIKYVEACFAPCLWYIMIETTPLALFHAGSDVIKALENGVSQYPKLEGRFPQVAGLSFGFDASKPPGQRVESRLVKVQGEYIDLNKVMNMI